MSVPSVLWIGVDQMRADTPGFAGNSVCRTPNLDALAERSVVFDRAYAPASQCTPSRASMFTGLYAFHHGMGNNCDMYDALARELPRPEQFLPARLDRVGYRRGYAGKWHVGSSRGPVDFGFEGMSLPGYGDLKVDPGFRSYLRGRALSYGPVRDPIYGNPGTTLLGGGWGGAAQTSPTRYLTDVGIELLDNFAHDERPFFLTLQYWAPHPPYLPPEEYLGLHDRSALVPPENLEDDLRRKPAGLLRFRRDFYRTLPETWDEGWRELQGLSYDYTAFVDHEIGRLLGHLRELGLERDTIVVFTSDHGDMNGAHGLFDKGFPYEEAHRVPLTIAWPQRWRPGRRSELVSNMDIMPTLLDVIDEVPGGLDGRSLLPLLRGGDAPWREHLLLEAHGMRSLQSQRVLVSDDGWKYVFTPADEDEVYDLGRDRAELHNLLGDPSMQGHVERLRAMLLDACRAHRDPLTEYVARLFGDWSNRSGQPDASIPIPGSGS